MNEVKKLQEEIIGIVKSSVGRNDREIKDLKNAVGRVRDHLEEIQAEVNGNAAASWRSTAARRDTPGSRLVRDFPNEIKMVKRVGKVQVAVEGGLFGTGEEKTLIDSTAVGSSTPGILVPERVRGVVPLPRRRLTLRDILPSRPTSNPAVEFIRATVEPLISPQVEGSAKGEAEAGFTIVSAPVRTFAAWIPATRQVLDDFSELARAVDDALLFKLKEKEEEQILSGDGVGQNLEGLIVGATAYDTGRNVGSDTKLDTLRHGVAQLRAGNEEPTFLVIHPDDAEEVELIKDQASNVGNYVAGDPKGTGGMAALWGMTLVETNAMTKGAFLVGDARMAEIFDRMEAVIDISTEHANFFTENKVAIRVEERIALAIYRTSAFVFGTFP